MSSRLRSRFSGRDRGFAVLAVFAVMAIFISALAAETLRQGYRRQTETINLLSSIATTRATASCIERELSEVVRSGVLASMYGTGMLGENSEQVEERIVSFLNARIEKGWSFSGFREISVHPADENSISLLWMPDGSLRVEASLRARILHISGVEVCGLRIEERVFPRFLRLARLARLAAEMLESGAGEDEVENEMNLRYACELVRFKISGGHVTVWDLYGGQVILA